MQLRNIILSMVNSLKIQNHIDCYHVLSQNRKLWKVLTRRMSEISTCRQIKAKLLSYSDLIWFGLVSSCLPWGSTMDDSGLSVTDQHDPLPSPAGDFQATNSWHHPTDGAHTEVSLQSHITETKVRQNMYITHISTSRKDNYCLHEHIFIDEYSNWSKYIDLSLSSYKFWRWSLSLVFDESVIHSAFLSY